jgi:hypothetical protein
MAFVDRYDAVDNRGGPRCQFLELFMSVCAGLTIKVAGKDVRNFEVRGLKL